MGYDIGKVRNFWNNNPMNYDFKGKFGRVKEGTPEFFRRIDKILFDATSFIQKGNKPFGKIIPFEDIKDKNVLEVGCGMGSVSQLMALYGANVTAIDLTSRAVQNTKKRFEILKQRYPSLENLKKTRILEANAESLPFEENSFDFVISWGVIHHSPNTQRCLNEISRVLKKGGQTSGMVYHKNSIVYYIHYLFLRGILMGKLLKYTPQQLADRYSDWYQKGGCAKAEHFTRKQWKRMMIKAGFSKKNIKLFVASQVTDIYPPGFRWLDKIIPRTIPNQIFKIWGWFLCWDKVVK